MITITTCGHTLLLYSKTYIYLQGYVFTFYLFPSSYLNELTRIYPSYIVLFEQLLVKVDNPPYIHVHLKHLNTKRPSTVQVSHLNFCK